MGESSPGPAASPSMVVMSYPSACTANIRQERTGAPSRSTVQAADRPCWQPAWGPVGSRRSRRRSSRLMRGSTSSAHVSPLTVKSTRIGPYRGVVSIGDGAHGKMGGRAAPIVGRRMQVRQRLDLGKRGAYHLAHMRLLGARSLERACHCIEPQRTGCNAPDAQRETPANAVLVERHLCRGRGQCEIAAPCADLVKTNADTSIAPDRKAHGGEAGGCGGRRHHRPAKKIEGRPFSPSPPPPNDTTRTPRACH